jgi:hypothetical protein
LSRKSIFAEELKRKTIYCSTDIIKRTAISPATYTKKKDRLEVSKPIKDLEKQAGPLFYETQSPLAAALMNLAVARAVIGSKSKS